MNLKAHIFFKVFIALLLSALVFSSCHQKTKTSKIRAIERPNLQTGTNQTTETQIQNLQLNVNWNQTQILEDQGYQLVLKHTIEVNNKKFELDNRVEIGTGECTNLNAITYDVFNVVTHSNNIYTALGLSTCWINHDLFLGLTVMGWNNQALVQQFVLMNLKSNQLVLLQKNLVSSQNSDYLPSWMARHFVQ